MGTCAATVYVASADRTREMVAGGVDWDAAAVRATELDAGSDRTQLRIEAAKPRLYVSLLHPEALIMGMIGRSCQSYAATRERGRGSTSVR